MLRRPPRPSRTHTLFPCTPLFRSSSHKTSPHRSVPIFLSSPIVPIPPLDSVNNRDNAAQIPGRLTKRCGYSKLKKSRLSRARREDAGGGAGRRLPVQLDAALGEECLGGLACFCMGARGALPEAHAVLLIAHGPAEDRQSTRLNSSH